MCAAKYKSCSQCEQLLYFAAMPLNTKGEFLTSVYWYCVSKDWYMGGIVGSAWDFGPGLKHERSKHSVLMKDDC